MCAMVVFKRGRYWWCAGTTKAGDRWWASTSVPAHRSEAEAYEVAQRIERNGWFAIVTESHDVAVTYRTASGDGWYLWCAACQQKAARCKKCEAIHHLSDLGDVLICDACLGIDVPKPKPARKPSAKAKAISTTPDETQPQPKPTKPKVITSESRTGYASIDWKTWGERVVRQVAKRTQPGSYLALDCPQCNRRTLLLRTGNVRCETCRLKFYV